MTSFCRLSAASTLLLIAVGAASAQTAQQAEPGTSSPQVSPASASPQVHQDPNLRTDSTPHVSLSASTDSSPEQQQNLGLDATSFVALGLDTAPATPAGMVATSPADNPAMVYLALEHRTGDRITPADASLIAGRQSDLAAGAHRYGLPGTAYQQVVCPAAESRSVTSTGVAGGPGAVLLQYNQADGTGQTRFSVVLPRGGSPVQAIAIAHRKPSKPFRLKGHAAGIVNEALPPEMLFAHLQPREDWLATSACIAELGGAHMRIPLQADLDATAPTTAPGPLLRLLIDGERKVVLADKLDDTHYSIWSEEVTSKGKLHKAEQRTYIAKPFAVTNPPEPPIVTIVSMPQPPVRQMFPPSPLSGEKQ